MSWVLRTPKTPSQLQRTARLYLSRFFGGRGRENQREMKPGMLPLRMTPQELNGEFPGAVPLTKNHQGGLSDAEDESDANIFSAPDHPRWPVKKINNYLSHLNPTLDALFSGHGRWEVLILTKIKYGFETHHSDWTLSTPWWNQWVLAPEFSRTWQIIASGQYQLQYYLTAPARQDTSHQWSVTSLINL